jgi:hypothetical protein
MRAQPLQNPSRKFPSSNFVHLADRAPELTPDYHFGAVRGLLYASVLAVPIWLALYFLLR